MAGHNKKAEDMFGALVNEIVAQGMQSSKLDMDIITFARDILNVELWPTQRAIQKALYNLPLERGQWRDLFLRDPRHSDVQHEEVVLRKCERYNVEPDEWWDEREILETWAVEGKTTWVEGQVYSEISLECGMRGSKTSMISIPILYEYFKCMQHDDPAAYFGLMPGSLIAFLVLATSEEQAQDTLFAAIKGRIENSAYFQGLMQTGQLVVNSLDIYCPGKNLKLWAGHSRSAGLVGRTLMVFAMDEGNRFGIEAKGGATGVEMYANVGKGVTTLQRFGSKKIVISSAWCEGDLTDTLYEQAAGEGQHILAFRLCTWDMNPEFAKEKENHPFIQNEYRTRGIEAQRDFGGVRPGVEENFFSKVAVNKVAIHTPPVTYAPDSKTVKGADGTERTYATAHITVPDSMPIPPGWFSYGHCDPGLKHDSFGFVAGHPFLDHKTGLIGVDITTCVEWKPVDKGRGNIWQVSMESVEEELENIAPMLQLKRLTFDHWNSAMIIQKLYSKGVSTYEFKSSFSMNVQREIYQVTREWLNAERIKLPRPDSSPAAAKLHKELLELKLLNGRRIDHPKPKGSKDLSDCLACVVWHISQEERRFRSMEFGSNTVRPLGQIHAQQAISDVFYDDKSAAARNGNALRNDPSTRVLSRKTSVTQNDW